MKHVNPHDHRPDDAPVSVPLLLLTVHEDGAMTVIHDARLIPPPTGQTAWERSQFGQIIDHTTDNRRLPVRVEVHEADGSTFTDILPATARPTTTPKDDSQHEKPKYRGAPRRKTAAPIELNATEGFMAGEDVAVALIVSHTNALPDGSVRALIDPTLVEATGAREVILFGQVSGTTTIRGLS
ncbi:hypothetical protein ACX31A_08045 [Dermacoccus nishinomiyaensis]